MTIQVIISSRLSLSLTKPSSPIVYCPAAVRLFRRRWGASVVDLNSSFHELHLVLTFILLNSSFSFTHIYLLVWFLKFLSNLHGDSGGMLLVLAYIPFPSRHRTMELIHSSGVLLVLAITSSLFVAYHRRWICCSGRLLVSVYGYVCVRGVLLVLDLVLVKSEVISFKSSFSCLICSCSCSCLVQINPHFDLALVFSHPFMSCSSFIPSLSQSFGGRRELSTWVRCLSSISRVMARTGSSWKVIWGFAKDFGVRLSVVCLCLRRHPLGAASSMDMRSLTLSGNLMGFVEFSCSLEIGNFLRTYSVFWFQIRVLIIHRQRISLWLMIGMMLILDCESSIPSPFWSYHLQIRVFQSHRKVEVRQNLRLLKHTCLICRFKHAKDCVDFMVVVSWLFDNLFVRNFLCRTLVLKRSRPSFVQHVDYVKLHIFSMSFSQIVRCVIYLTICVFRVCNLAFYAYY